MFRIFSFALIAAVLGWHVLATALYLLPNNPLTPYYSATISSYMDPVFSQNWQLFAPEPATSSLQLWYRCKNSPEKNWSSWKDPVKNLLEEHRENRFTFRGKLTYVYQSIARNSLNDYVTQRERFFKNCSKDSSCRFPEVDFYKSSSYQLARRFTKDLCQKEGFYGKAQFQIVKAFTKNFSQRHLVNHGKVETVRLRPFSL